MAGRKSVSVKTISKHLTKDEKLIREAVEDKIKGKCDKLIPPDYLNDGQREIFYFIVDELSESNILGNLDKFAIEKASVAVERTQIMEKKINEDPSLLENATFINTKTKYDTIFNKMCDSLCLTPSARAKVALACSNKVNENKNPLLAALEDDDEEDE